MDIPISEMVRANTPIGSDLHPIVQGGMNKAIAWDDLKADVPTGAGMPPGFLAPFAGPSIPAGWLACDGSAVSRTTFGPLFAAIGTTWGPGDGLTTFNLPELRGRVVLGDGTGPGLNTRTLGGSGGEESHILVQGELPSYALPVSDPGHTHTTLGNLVGDNTAGSQLDNSPNSPLTGSAFGATINTAATGIAVNSGGSDVAHENMQPWSAAKWLVKT